MQLRELILAIKKEKQESLFQTRSRIKAKKVNYKMRECVHSEFFCVY